VIFDKEQIDLVRADCIRPTLRLRLSIERDCHRVEGRIASAPTDCGYIHQRKSPVLTQPQLSTHFLDPVTIKVTR
jgi:hypothetical protein